MQRGDLLLQNGKNSQNVVVLFIHLGLSTRAFVGHTDTSKSMAKCKKAGHARDEAWTTDWTQAGYFNGKVEIICSHIAVIEMWEQLMKQGSYWIRYL